MRLLSITVVFLLSVSWSYCQEIFFETGLGLGNVLQERVFKRTKTLIYFQLNRNVTERVNIGIYFNSGGDFLIPFGEPSIETMDTTFLLPEGMGFNSLFGTASYTLFEGLQITGMAGMLTHRLFVHTDEVDKLRKLEIGYGLTLKYVIQEGFTIAASFQSGGSSPDLNGVKDGRIVVMKGRVLPMAYLTFGYQFELLKKRNRK